MDRQTDRQTDGCRPLSPLAAKTNFGAVCGCAVCRVDDVDYCAVCYSYVAALSARKTAWRLKGAEPRLPLDAPQPEDSGAFFWFSEKTDEIKQEEEAAKGGEQVEAIEINKRRTPRSAVNAARLAGLAGLPAPSQVMREVQLYMSEAGDVPGVVLNPLSSFPVLPLPRSNPCWVRALNLGKFRFSFSQQQLLERLNVTSLLPLHYANFETLRIVGQRLEGGGTRAKNLPKHLTILFLAEEATWPLIIHGRFGGGSCEGVPHFDSFREGDNHDMCLTDGVLVGSFVGGRVNGELDRGAVNYRGGLSEPFSAKRDSLGDGQWSIEIHRAQSRGFPSFQGSVSYNGGHCVWNAFSIVPEKALPVFLAVGGRLSSQPPDAVLFASESGRHLELLLPSSDEELSAYIDVPPPEALQRWAQAQTLLPAIRCTGGEGPSASQTKAAAEEAGSQTGAAPEAAAVEEEEGESKALQGAKETQCAVARESLEAIHARLTAEAFSERPLLRVLLPIDCMQRQASTAALRAWQSEVGLQAQNLAILELLDAPELAVALWPAVLRFAADTVRARPSLRGALAALFVAMIKQAAKNSSSSSAVARGSASAERAGEEEDSPSPTPEFLVENLRALCLMQLLSAGLLHSHAEAQHKAFLQLKAQGTAGEEAVEGFQEATPSAPSSAEGSDLSVPSGPGVVEWRGETQTLSCARGLFSGREARFRPGSARNLVLGREDGASSSAASEDGSRGQRPPLVAVDWLSLSRRGFLRDGVVLRGFSAESAHPYSAMRQLQATAALRGEFLNWGEDVTPPHPPLEALDSRFEWARGSVVLFSRLSGSRLGDSLRFYGSEDGVCVASYR